MSIQRLRKLISPLIITLIISCGGTGKENKSIDLIADGKQQDSIFKKLINLTQHTIPENALDDSLAFLILPVHASCPSCREKVIDGIVKHQDQLPAAHYIIISADAGRKTINAFFEERESVLPVIENRLFLDSTNQAAKYDLYFDKPTIYYTHNQKAYKKVGAIPTTVREDLKEFFSGNDDERRVVKHE